MVQQPTSSTTQADGLGRRRQFQHDGFANVLLFSTDILHVPRIHRRDFNLRHSRPRFESFPPRPNIRSSITISKRTDPSSSPVPLSSPKRLLTDASPLYQGTAAGLHQSGTLAADASRATNMAAVAAASYPSMSAALSSCANPVLLSSQVSSSTSLPVSFRPPRFPQH